MKPEDLKPPCTKTEQRILIHDRVWYVPVRSAAPCDFVFPGWNHADVFGNDNPVIVEYCSGNGAWIANKAIQNPLVNWVAVERKFERVRKIWSKVKNHALNNLLIICGEAYQTTERFFFENSISEVHINFPDPWPKNRHAKNRLVRAEFADQLCRILKSDGSLTFVTDDAPYSEWTIDVMQKHGRFVSSYPAPHFISDESSYGTSYFDQLWRSKGRTIRYHRFQKK